MSDKVPWEQWEFDVLDDDFPDHGAQHVRQTLRKCGRIRTCSSIRSKAKARGVTRRGRWKKQEAAYCLPEQTLSQQLDCVRLRKWKGPVNRERPLMARVA